MRWSCPGCYFLFRGRNWYFFLQSRKKILLPLLFTLSTIVEENNCLPRSTLVPGLIAKYCLRTVKSRLALRSRLFFCSIVYHHAENGLIHRKTVVDRPIVTTSVGDTLFQTRKNRPSQSFAKLTLGLFSPTPGNGEDATEVLRQLQHRLVIAHPFQCTNKIWLIDITILLNIFP